MAQIQTLLEERKTSFAVGMQVFLRRGVSGPGEDKAIYLFLMSMRVQLMES